MRDMRNRPAPLTIPSWLNGLPRPAALVVVRAGLGSRAQLRAAIDSNLFGPKYTLGLGESHWQAILTWLGIAAFATPVHGASRHDTDQVPKSAPTLAFEQLPSKAAAASARPPGTRAALAQPLVRPIFLDTTAVAALLSISESTVQSLVRLGDLPAPRKISAARVGWLLREIEEWAEARPVSDLLPPRNCRFGRRGQPQ